MDIEGTVLSNYVVISKALSHEGHDEDGKYVYKNIIELKCIANDKYGCFYFVYCYIINTNDLPAKIWMLWREHPDSSYVGIATMSPPRQREEERWTSAIKDYEEARADRSEISAEIYLDDKHYAEILSLLRGINADYVAQVEFDIEWPARAPVTETRIVNIHSFCFNIKTTDIVRLTREYERMDR